MELDLTDRVALVTGAAGGIGGAVADALAREGCDLALLDSCAAGLKAAVGRVEAHGRRAIAIAADVRQYDRATEVVAEVVAALGGLDILVCSAGITSDGMSWKLEEQAWDDVLAVNLKGCFNYAHAATPALRARGGGRIINIASINGVRGKIGQANYTASKAGVIGLSKTLTRELGRFGITVNVIAPGMVNTGMTRNLDAQFVTAAVHESVLGMLATPADVADAVVFLSSARARSITGETLRVDAGQYL